MALLPPFFWAVGFQHSTEKFLEFWVCYVYQYMFMCVRAHLCECMYTWYAHVWRSEVGVRYLPQKLSTLIFETTLSTEPRAH